MAIDHSSIPVESDIAQAYNSVSDEDRKKMQWLMRLWLREMSTSHLSLGEVMDMISDRAEARGLTPEILESILKEE